MSAQSANPVIFIVARLIGGFAREDSPTVDIVGCYTDEALAKQVALGTSAKVIPTTLNTLAEGILHNLQQLGLMVGTKLSALAADVERNLNQLGQKIDIEAKAPIAPGEVSSQVAGQTEFERGRAAEQDRLAAELFERGGFATLQLNPNPEGLPRIRFVDPAETQPVDAVRLQDGLLLVRDPG